MINTDEVRPSIVISHLTPLAGIILTDGLILPCPAIFINGSAFMWDVTAPNEQDMSWEGWSEEKLKIFEVVTPRPGQWIPFPERRASTRTEDCVSKYRDLAGWDGEARLVSSAVLQEVLERVGNSGRRFGFRELLFPFQDRSLAHQKIVHFRKMLARRTTCWRKKDDGWQLQFIPSHHSTHEQVSHPNPPMHRVFPPNVVTMQCNECIKLIMTVFF